MPIELVDGEIRTSGHLVSPTGRYLRDPEPQSLPPEEPVIAPLTVAPELPLTWAALEESMARVYEGLRVPSLLLQSFQQSMVDLNLQMEETANLYRVPMVRSMPRMSSMSVNFGLLYGMDLGFVSTDSPVVVLPAPVMVLGPARTVWERLLMDSHFD